MKRPFVIFVIILSFVLILFSVRFFSHTEIDDVSSEIFCEEEYLIKSDILWVIPKYNDVPISSNRTWCEYILSLNKTLGLHGVYHEYKEFGVNRNQEYLDDGIEIFKECFGFSPTMFKPPQLKINDENQQLIEDNDIKLRRYFNQVTHKVYHCSDTGIYPNWFVDLF